MRVRVKANYTMAALTAYQKLLGKTVHKEQVSSSRKVYSLVGGFGILLFFVLEGLGDGGVLTWLLGLVGVGFLLLMAAFYPYMAFRIWRKLPKKDRTCTVTFYDDEVESVTVVETNRLPYDQLYALWDWGDALYLFVTDQSAFLLPKGDFNIGTAEELKALWTEKTGKQVEYPKI